MQDTRRFRIMQLMSIIEACCEAGHSVNEEKIIAEFCSSFAVARRTALEYLNELEQIKRIIRKDGDLFTPKLFAEFQILNSKPEEEADKILNSKPFEDAI